jgi:hypothetical protein
MLTVGRVLTGNGITEVQQGRYRLIGGEELSDTERDELLQLCRQRLDVTAARSAVRSSSPVGRPRPRESVARCRPLEACGLEW